MAKTLVEAQLTTKNARIKLPQGLHLRSIDPATHLAYRKGVRGGNWVVRRYLGAGKYEQDTLGAADDALPANGIDTLDYGQALAKAKLWVIEKQADAKAKASGPVLTVKMAVDEYIQFREGRERQEAGEGSLKRDTRSRLTKYVLGTALANKPLHRLDEDDLVNWKSALPDHLALGTVRRLNNDLKACLNRSAVIYRKRLPPEFGQVVQFGLKAVTANASEARRQVLPDNQIRAILKAARKIDDRDQWHGDLFRLLLVMASTGARQSQAQRLKVGDVQIKQSRLMMPTSRKGRGQKQIEHTAIAVSREVIDSLAPVLDVRGQDATLLERWRHVQKSPTEWAQGRRGPWKSPSEITRPWSQILQEADLPSDVLPYSLRHSSIVRGLRAGLPTRHVAALHDTSSAMIEKHYSAYIVDAMDDLAAKAVTSLL